MVELKQLHLAGGYDPGSTWPRSTEEYDGTSWTCSGNLNYTTTRTVINGGGTQIKQAF